MPRAPKPPRRAVKVPPVDPTDDDNSGGLKMIVATVNIPVYEAFVLYCIRNHKRSRQDAAATIIREFLKTNGYPEI